MGESSRGSTEIANNWRGLCPAVNCGKLMMMMIMMMMMMIMMMMMVVVVVVVMMMISIKCYYCLTIVYFGL
jgi:hypothetical protein